MSRVLLLSHTTGYQLRAFDAAAAHLGIALRFATDRCHLLDDPWRDHAVAVRFYDVPGAVDTIADAVASEPIDGIIAVGDRPVPLAAEAAARLSLPWHHVRGAAASADKRQSRAIWSAAGLPSPGYVIAPLRRIGEALDHASFPAVLKPVGLSGSRGVIRADDPSEGRAAAARIARLLNRPEVRASRAGLGDEILIEDYVEGDEFALEGVMTRGALQVFAIFDKPDPLTGPFFEETIYVTPSRASAAVQAAIVETVATGAGALGLSHGPIHAECRVTPSGRVVLLEIAARPIGGLCSRVLTFAGGASLEAVLLQHAAGAEVSRVQREALAAAVLMIPIPRRGLLRGVTGTEEARKVPGVTDVHISARPDQLLEPLPEAGSYLGFIFARAATPAGAEAAVRAAHAHLTFDIQRQIVVN